jgi:Ca2+-binding EF-hand superfamily protein
VHTRQFSAAEFDAMQRQFDVIDTDGNKVLDPDEMRAFAKLYDIQTEFVGLAFLLFDRQKRGGLDFEEFMEFTKSIDKNPRCFYRRVFDALDTTGSGALSSAEFVHFGQLLGIPLTLAEVQEVTRSMDLTGTGKLTFDDLFRWVNVGKQR